jgi:hypothetical protein
MTAKLSALSQETIKRVANDHSLWKDPTED